MFQNIGIKSLSRKKPISKHVRLNPYEVESINFILQNNIMTWVICLLPVVWSDFQFVTRIIKHHKVLLLFVHYFRNTQNLQYNFIYKAH